MSDLFGKWVVVTPGDTPLVYNCAGEALYAHTKMKAVDNVLIDMQGLYSSWAEMKERGYTVEQIGDAK